MYVFSCIWGFVLYFESLWEKEIRQRKQNYGRWMHYFLWLVVFPGIDSSQFPVYLKRSNSFNRLLWERLQGNKEFWSKIFLNCVFIDCFNMHYIILNNFVGMFSQTSPYKYILFLFFILFRYSHMHCSHLCTISIIFV